MWRRSLCSSSWSVSSTQLAIVNEHQPVLSGLHVLDARLYPGLFEPSTSLASLVSGSGTRHSLRLSSLRSPDTVTPPSWERLVVLLAVLFDRDGDVAVKARGAVAVLLLSTLSFARGPSFG